MKILFPSIIIVALLVAFVGCGKSEATKAAEQERHDARQKFNEAIAAIKVRTQGSTYPEFRQAELDLKTSYEANKAYLADVSNQFANLDALVKATDYFWSYNVQYPDLPLLPTKDEIRFAQTINPDTHLSEKTGYHLDQQLKDPEFYAKNYVEKGLKKIDGQAEDLLNSLAK